MGFAANILRVRDQVVSDTNPYPVVIGAPSSTNTAGYNPSVTFTRTADTTAYTAGDVIGINNAGSPGSAIHTLTSAGPAGSSIVVLGASLLINATAIPSGMTSFRLHLYNASPTAILDNAAWDLPSGDQTAYLGYVDLGNIVDMGSTLYGEVTQVNKCIKLASSVTSVYAELVTNGGFTPASGTSFTIKLQTGAY